MSHPLILAQTPLAAPLRPSRIAAALHSQDLRKPQLVFSHPVQNFEKPPFKPLLSQKPHAKTSLKESLQVRESEDGVKL